MYIIPIHLQCLCCQYLLTLGFGYFLYKAIKTQVFKKKNNLGCRYFLYIPGCGFQDNTIFLFFIMAPVYVGNFTNIKFEGFFIKT